MTLFTIESDGAHKRKLIYRRQPAPGGARNLCVETVSANRKRTHLLAPESAAALLWGGPSGRRTASGYSPSVEPH
jgi:hypothetical protein